MRTPRSYDWGMRTTLTALVILALLAIDWLKFHDLAEPHAPVDYLVGVVSILAIALLAQPMVDSIRRRSSRE